MKCTKVQHAALQHLEQCPFCSFIQYREAQEPHGFRAPMTLQERLSADVRTWAHSPLNGSPEELRTALRGTVKLWTAMYGPEPLGYDAAQLLERLVKLYPRLRARAWRAAA